MRRGALGHDDHRKTERAAFSGRHAVDILGAR
jgi:hypothetical protein